MELANKYHLNKKVNICFKENKTNINKLNGDEFSNIKRIKENFN